MPNRRKFLKTTALTGVGVMAAAPAFGMPWINTERRVPFRTERGTLTFRPVYVQRGRGPHIEPDWIYATDTNWDTFRSNIHLADDGIRISDTGGQERFGINVRWNVEGIGYLFLTADNAGEGYALPAPGRMESLNLNYELARSRIHRNNRRLEKHRAAGWAPSRTVDALQGLAQQYLEDATGAGADELRGRFAQTALRYGIDVSEKIELEKAQHDVGRMGHRPEFFIGCDARSFYHMSPDDFMELFTELFNYATITYYLSSRHIEHFEPEEGRRQFNLRDALFRRLRNADITVEGRPLFWPHPAVTPEWMKEMSFDQSKRYVERHVREVVGHYGDEMYAWEVVNEMHDWSNEMEFTPDEIVEITKLACDVARDTDPNVHRLINNCCPWAEYVQQGLWVNREARYPQRTPVQFMQALVDADVDFTISGVQMYFPFRDLADTIIHIERYEQFGRPVQLTEVGATSGPSDTTVKLNTMGIPEGPYAWRRHWDEELQADWMEGLYTLGYSKPWIEAINWYDFIDGHAWIRQGGLIRSLQGEKKAVFDRMKTLQKEWAALPSRINNPTGCRAC